MGLFEQLKPASFRGVKFLVDSSSIAGGRKTVTHEFVNSDRRFVEDLGKLNKTISFVAIVTGSDYIQRREQLISALEKKGPGLLSLPFDQNLNVSSKPYNLSETFSQLGQAVFELNFEVTQDAILPVESTGQTSTISNAVEAAQNRAEQTLGAEMVFSTANNLLGSISQVQRLLDNVRGLGTRFVGNINFISDTSSIVESIEDDITRIVQTPTLLASSVLGLFNSIEDSASSDFENSIKVFETFYNFDNDRIVLDVDTPEINQRDRNLNLFSEYAKTLSLLANYRNVTQVDFLTDIEIDQQNSALQDQFIIVTENTVLNDNDQEEINGVRNQVNQFLTDQSKAAFKVETKVFKLKPVTISTYELYGSTDNTKSIIDLNAIKDVSFASGPLKILVT
ncbi:MAG: DNA circularization N-terminal domain-containing protein [Candidatus Neomarinimicrobiota bacterium]